MTGEMPDGVIPIDREVRSVVDEFSRDPLAMAAEIVRLRAELGEARSNVGGPPPEIVLRQPQAPPDAPPPARFGDGPGDE